MVETEYTDQDKIIHKELDEIYPFMKKLDKTVNELPYNRLKKPNFRVYRKNNFKKTDFAYVSMVFGGETYIPALFTLAHSLRKNGCKENIVCLVQDRDSQKTIDGEKRIFKAVSKNTINDLLDIYDVVYGMDLLHVSLNRKDLPDDHFTKKLEHYKNISIYATKLQVFGLTDYKKIFYLDSSDVAIKNLDIGFKKHKGNSFIIDKYYYQTKMGVHGGFFIIKPSLKFYTKALFLIKNYVLIFDTLHFTRGLDEIIIYFTVYPHWDSLLINKIKKCSSELISEETCYVYHHQIYKPFKPIDPSNNTRNKSEITFKNWDKYTKDLIIKYPHLSKYFSHIKDFRNVNY